MMNSSYKKSKSIEKIRHNNKKHSDVVDTPSMAIDLLQDDSQFRNRYIEMRQMISKKLSEKMCYNPLETENDIKIAKKYILEAMVKIDDWTISDLPKRHINEDFDKSSLNNVVIIEYRKKGLHNLFDELFFFTSNGGYYTINLSTGSITIDDLIDIIRETHKTKKAKKKSQDGESDVYKSNVTPAYILSSIFRFINGELAITEIEKRWQWIEKKDSDTSYFIDSEYQKNNTYIVQDFIREFDEISKSNDCHSTFEKCAKKLLNDEINGFQYYIRNKYNGIVRNLFEPDISIKNRIFAIKLCFALEMNLDEANSFLTNACGMRALNNQRNLLDNIYEYCLTNGLPYAPAPNEKSNEIEYASFEQMLYEYETSNYSVNSNESSIDEPIYIPGQTGNTTFILRQSAELHSGSEEEFLNKHLIANRDKFLNNSYKIRRLYYTLKCQTVINYIGSTLNKYSLYVKKLDDLTQRREIGIYMVELYPILKNLSSNKLLTSLDNICEKYSMPSLTNRLTILKRFNSLWLKQIKEKERYYDLDKLKRKLNDYILVSKQGAEELRFYDAFIDGKIITVELINELADLLSFMVVFSEERLQKVIDTIMSLGKVHEAIIEKADTRSRMNDYCENLDMLLYLESNIDLSKIKDLSNIFIVNKDEKTLLELLNELRQLQRFYTTDLLNTTKEIGNLIPVSEIANKTVHIKYSKKNKKNNYKQYATTKGSSLSDTVLQDYMREGTMSKFERENNKIDTTFSVSTRKTVVLMFFFRYIVDWNNADEKKCFDDFVEKLNKALNSCNLPLLDQYDYFDWLILNTIKLFDNASTDDDYANAAEFYDKVIDLSYQETNDFDLSSQTDNSKKSLLVLRDDERIVILCYNIVQPHDANLVSEYIFELSKTAIIIEEFKDQVPSLYEHIEKLQTRLEQNYKRVFNRYKKNYTPGETHFDKNIWPDELEYFENNVIREICSSVNSSLTEDEEKVITVQFFNMLNSDVVVNVKKVDKCFSELFETIDISDGDAVQNYLDDSDDDLFYTVVDYNSKINTIVATMAILYLGYAEKKMDIESLKSEVLSQKDQA